MRQPRRCRRSSGHGRRQQVEAHDVEPERRRARHVATSIARRSEDSEQLEIEVRAYPGDQAAALPAQLPSIPKGILGSVWVTLIDKYLLYRPTYRLLADLRAHGLDRTVTDVCVVWRRCSRRCGRR